MLTVCEQYFETLEKPSASVFAKMSERGISLDLHYLTDLKAVLEQKIKPIVTELKNELGDINLNSPKQLLEALNAKGIKPILKGKPSTDKRAMEKFKGHHIVSSLFAYSELSTLLSNFVESYLDRNEEVVHPTFLQTGTRTGRPSCSNPNLLQIPRRSENGKLVRQMFISREGCLFGDCDYGQIEPRLLAHLSKDKNMLTMFNDGIDFHTFTAERLGIERDKAKILNLSVGYRATYKSVSQQLHCSWSEAQATINEWWLLFPGLYDWENRLIYESKKSGYCTTLIGRRIRIDELNSNNEWRREGAERQLINNITQGSAAEVMKAAMIEVDKAGIDILVQVYDSLLIESPKDRIEDEILTTTNLMENTTKLDVPLTVTAKIGPNWGECE
jgi:DNA polymerase-1